MNIDTSIPISLPAWVGIVTSASILLERDDAESQLAGTLLLSNVADVTGWVAEYVPAELWKPIKAYWEAEVHDQGRAAQLYEEFSKVGQPILQEAYDRWQQQEA